MNIFSVLAAIFALTQFSYAQNGKPKCNLVSCPSVPHHYIELGCNPIKDQCGCVTNFKCPNWKQFNKNSCTYNNKTYALGERMPSEGCNVGCFCSKRGEDELATFICATVDCPEAFGGFHEPSRKCIYQHKKGHCCLSGKVCEDETEKWNSLAKCQFEGETYSEGQIMEPKNSCHTCYCKKGFNGRTPIENNPHCQKNNCGILLRSTTRLYEGCAPVYYKDLKCCPIDWVCPYELEAVHKQKSSLNPQNPSCSLGELKFNIGDKFNLTDCKTCTCEVPPLMTCHQKC